MIEDRFRDSATLAEPEEFYDAIRDSRGVFFSENLNAYVVARYDEAREVLMNPEDFSSYPANANRNTMAAFAEEYKDIYEAKGTYLQLPTLVVTDGKMHRRYRSTSDKAFAPAAVKKMEPAIRSIANELIDSFIKAGRTDLYSEFCLKLPSFVMCDLLGLPREAAPILKRGADTSPRLASAALESEETVRELIGERADMYVYIQKYVTKYRAEPGDNMISRLIEYVPDDGTPLTDRELLSLAGTLNVGGNETATNGLGNLMYRALSEAGMIERVRAEPAILPALIEESLRIDSPVSALPRWVMRDVAIGDTKIPKGATVFVSFLGANHDAAKFGCPHEFKADREGARQHLAFGGGPHFCLGASLARLELKIAFETLLDRLCDIHFDDERLPIQRQPKFVIRGVESLPVTFKSV